MKSKAVKTYLSQKESLDRSLIFLFTKTLDNENKEIEQRRKTMLFNKKKTNEGEDLKALDLIERTKKEIKEIHLFYGVLRSNEKLESARNSETEKIIQSTTDRLMKSHGYTQEQIDEIKWDVDPSIHSRYKEWCSSTGNEFHKYTSLDKYLKQ